MTGPTAPASAECIICSAPAPEGGNYCGQVCRIADATGEQPPEWD
ncbi:hypothetical protein ACIBCT_38955 [Streptosporangium sp. NPDC050855]